MSGSYVGSFGERMKDFPRRHPQGPVQRAPLWIRFRYSWRQGSRSNAGPWLYCYWERKLAEIPLFARGVIQGATEIERLGREKPANLHPTPERRVGAVALFMEKL